MNADFEVERDGTVSLARRGKEGSDGTWQSRTVLESVPADPIYLGLSWDPEDCIRLRLDAYHVEGGAGSDAWHINLRMPLSRAQARGLMQFLALALSQDGEE